MTERKTYNALAVPDGRWYGIRIFGLPPEMVGVTQSPVDEGLEGIESMTREVIALLLQVGEDSFDLNVVVQAPDPDLEERIRRGIEQAERGETHDLGDFTQYLKEDEGEQTDEA